MPFDFDLPQFSTQELLACSPGLNHETYKQWLKRNSVQLSVGESIGKGRRPQYRGFDVVQVALKHALSSHGEFFTKSHFIWHLVQGRLIARQTGLAAMSPGPMSAFFYIHPLSGELMQLIISETADGDPEAINRPEVPDLHLFFRIDRFIDRVVERMQRVKAGLPAVEPVRPEDAQNWVSEWSVDEAGNRVLVGLSREETAELARLSIKMEKGKLKEEEYTSVKDRFDYLDAKHVKARATRLASNKPIDDDADVMRAWTNDADGNRVRVGLTKAENDEYEALSARSLESRLNEDAFPWASVDEMNAERSRWLDLHSQHEGARQKRLAEEFQKKRVDYLKSRGVNID